MSAHRIHPKTTVRRMLARLDERARRLAREGRISAACATWGVSDRLYYTQLQARISAPASPNNPDEPGQRPRL